MSSQSRKNKKTAAKKAQGDDAAPAPWRRVTVDVKDSAEEPVSAVLLDEGALGLEVADDETRRIPDEPFEPTGRAQITATYARENGLEARVAAALSRVVTYFDDAADMAITWEDLFAEDWNAVFKSHWSPQELAEGVFIVPTWDEDFVTPDGAIALRLDPGMAFGTGTHPTTRLCARALADVCRERPPQQLLDVGTGSGILALIALALGTKRAVGTDIDPVALDAARDNAVQNGMDGLFTRASAPDADGPIYDAVVANILAGPLCELAPAIVGAMAPGARLWLSGILEEQHDTVVDAYTAAGLKHIGTEREGGWVRIDLRR